MTEPSEPEAVMSPIGMATDAEIAASEATELLANQLHAAFGKGHGTAWLRANGKEVGDTGSRVAELVDWLFYGIYHIDDAATRADWTSDLYVELRLGQNLATWDSDRLTRLVVGCHDAAIRCEIEACSRVTLRLRFHPRASREGHMYERHPTIERALVQMQRMEVRP